MAAALPHPAAGAAELAGLGDVRIDEPERRVVVGRLRNSLTLDPQGSEPDALRANPAISAEGGLIKGLSKLPSEYIRANVRATFQDDVTA